MNTFKISEQSWLKAKRVVAGGAASSLRASMKPVPLYVSSASGSKLLDADGNEYIDYLLAYGPLILGHAHPEWTALVQNSLLRGVTYGLQHEGEIELASLLTDILPCADKVAFSGSGTEAVMIALRLARAYTRKSKVIRFEGHYHGWSDTIFTSFPSPDMRGEAEKVTMAGTAGQSENALQDILLVKWNDAEELERVLTEHADEIACVITEPVMCNSGCLAPNPGYLERMRELTTRFGIVLIFDEVITGFRLGLSGAQGRFGVTPDLGIFGKAIAGGVALSAVAGKADIMRLIDEGTVNHLGTLNGSTLSMTAGLATLALLSEGEGRAYSRMEEGMNRLASGLRKSLQRHGIPGIVNRIGSVMHMMFIDKPEVSDFDTFQQRDSARYTVFASKMLEAGILIRPSGLWYISTVHTDEDIDRTIGTADQVLAAL
ncbi:aspartate aminotransferase family protein [Paenibacillus beijingensis]|uniref:Class III aminotransferase n=1 Tax=Paenibacillus beijingensis TaxID=1126833 RepID=A0A0D5NKM6_9BACL|nr:aspartate aminotransferase family protein [Paenibacillus beijingensis]AJY75904.1 class III aminotransferase [Paenibacillus beijingensis]